MTKLLTILVLSFFVYALSDAVADSKQAAQNPNKIKLGVIVPLSGPLTFFGQDFVRAFELAAAEQPSINDLITFYWEDSAYDSKQAVSAFNKLASVDKVDVIWSFGGPMLSALAPLAESKKIPFFATESEKSDCAGRQFCSLFRNEEDEWGKATWQVLRKQGKSKIGIVKNQNQFMNTFVNAIIRTKNAHEKVEVVLDVPPETVDLRTNVLSLKSIKIDALGVYFLPSSHHGFLSALRTSNTTFPLFGVEEFLERDNNKGFESLIDGTLVIAPGAIDSYRTNFENKYGQSAGFYYTPAFYDFLMLLKDTVANKSSLRGIELVRAMHFSGERSGVSGKYSVKVSKDGVYSYSFPIFVYKLSGGKVSVDQVINF